MNALMTAIVIWLSANFGVPATFDHPTVKFTPAMEIAFLRYGADNPEARDAVRAQYRSALTSENARRVVAIYDDATKTIHLPIGWTGRTPAELSVLIHEMVHHLQGKASMNFACAAEREKLAYAAQAKWLALFGSSLSKEFAIDALTLKLSTTCIY